MRLSAYRLLSWRRPSEAGQLSAWLIRPARQGVVESDLVAERAQGPDHLAEELTAALGQRPRLVGEMQVAPEFAWWVGLLMSEE